MRMHFVSFTYKKQRRISADSAGISAPWRFATSIVRVIFLVSSCLFLGMDKYCSSAMVSIPSCKHARVITHFYIVN